MTPTEVVHRLLSEAEIPAEINPTGEIVATINHEYVQITVEAF